MIASKNSLATFGLVLLILATACGPGCRKRHDAPLPVKESDRTTALKNDEPLAVVAQVGPYRVSLPSSFKALDIPGSPQPNVKLGIWKEKASAGEVPSGLVIAVLSDPKLAKEAKDMRQFLVNYSTGFMEQTGIAIAKRGKTEVLDLGGLQFSRFRWTGQWRGKTPAEGLVYGAVDGGQVITIIVMGFGTRAGADTQRLEAAVATFKRQ